MPAKTSFFALLCCLFMVFAPQVQAQDEPLPPASEPDSKPSPEPQPEDSQAAEESAEILAEDTPEPSEQPETEEPETQAEASPDPRRALGGRNISAYTRRQGFNLLGTTIGGYFDTEFYFPTGRNSYFDNHHLILQVSSYFHERMFFNTEIEFEHGGVLGFGSNDGELKIEQGYLDFQIEDWLILRGGVVLIPVGRLNILHDSDFRDTTIRPLFSQVIVPTTWMEPGLGAYGTFYPNDEWEMNYEVYVSQGLTDQIEDGRGLLGAKPSLAKDNNAGKALSGRVGLSPFIGLDLGLGGYFSAIDAEGRKNLGMVVADASYTLGPWEFLGEAGTVFFDPITRLDTQGQSQTLKGPLWGYYLEGHYHFFPEFLKETFLGQGFEKAVFTAFARISQVDTDASVLNINDRLHLTAGLNYRPTPNTAIKLEYQWCIETQALVTGDPSKEIANDQIVASLAVGF